MGQSSIGHAVLTAASGFDNSGTITLDSQYTGYSSTLTVTGGTLTNAAGGVINTNQTTVGPRTIAANLTNNGRVNINTDTTFIKTGAQYTNNGDFNIAASKTLTLTGSGVNFTNAPGGTIAGEGELNLGTATFANSGRIAPGTSPGILTITGDVPFSATAELAIEITGPTVGDDYDRLVVTGQADLAGTLTVDLDAYVPDPGQSFVILAAGGLVGTFDNAATTVALSPAGTFDVIYDYDADTVTLTNYVPEPAAVFLLLAAAPLLRRRRA